jgi:putative restriction endonuclease
MVVASSASRHSSQIKNSSGNSPVSRYFAVLRHASARTRNPSSNWPRSRLSMVIRNVLPISGTTTWPGTRVLASTFLLHWKEYVWHCHCMARAPGVRWRREHFLIALNLYCKLPFGKLHKGNPIIIEVAEKMGRTPSSLAMKLCNFASLDPVQQARGIKGLAGATAEDRAMWDEFHTDMSVLAPESEQLLHDLFTRDQNAELDFLRRDRVQLEKQPAWSTVIGATEVQALVRIRRGQQFFRQTILNAYSVSCCISGINVPSLLVASHIKPWFKFPEERLNPRNGLCLSHLHHAAFDNGLITFDEQLRLVLSKRLRSFFPQPLLEKSFAEFEGQRIRLAEKLAEPSPEFLRHHREVLFDHG